MHVCMFSKYKKKNQQQQPDVPYVFNIDIYFDEENNLLMRNKFSAIECFRSFPNDTDVKNCNSICILMQFFYFYYLINFNLIIFA